MCSADFFQSIDQIEVMLDEMIHKVRYGMWCSWPEPNDASPSSHDCIAPAIASTITEILRIMK